MLIVHTTALTDDEDEAALAHAAALALRANASLVSVHAQPASQATVEAAQLPSARPLLVRWGAATAALRHERVVHQCCDDTADTLLDALRRLRPDLIVSSTHARSGVARLLSGSVAEAVARNAPGPTLLLPSHCKGFVSQADGQVRLQRILVPAGSAAEVEQALDAAFALALDVGQRELELVLLHVADGRPAPAVSPPRGWRVTPRTATGPLAPAIASAARELKPDLVVMATHGHDGIVDVLLGSVTERVLHGLSCPLLWVPAAWRGQVGRS